MSQIPQSASASAAIRSFASGLLNALSIPADDRSNSFPVPPPPSSYSRSTGVTTSPSNSIEKTSSSSSTRMAARAGAPAGGGGSTGVTGVTGGRSQSALSALDESSSYPSEHDRIATLAVKATKRASALEKRCRVLREGLLSAVGVLEDASAVLDELTGRPLGHWMIVDERSATSSSLSSNLVKPPSTGSTSATTSSSNGDLLLKAVRQEVGSLVQRSKSGLSAVAASISGQGFADKTYPEAPFVGFKLDMNRFYDDLLYTMGNNAEDDGGGGGGDRDKRLMTTSSSAALAFPDGGGGGGGGPLGNDEAATLSALCASQSAQLRKLNSDLISSQREHLSTTQELRAALSAALRMADQTKSSGASSSGGGTNGIDGVEVDDDEEGGKRSVSDAYTLRLLEQLKDARDEVERAKRQEAVLIKEIENTRSELVMVKSEACRLEATKEAVIKETESEIHSLRSKIKEAETITAQLREKHEADRARAAAVESHSARMVKLQLCQLEAEVKFLKASKDQTSNGEGGGGGGASSRTSPSRNPSSSISNNSPVPLPSLDVETLKAELQKSEERRLDLERRTKAQAAALEEARVHAQASVPVQYLKSVTIHFISIAGDPWSGTQRKPLINVLATLLDFSAEERKRVGAPPAPVTAGVASVGYSLLVSPVSQEKKEGLSRCSPSTSSSSSSSSLVHPPFPIHDTSSANDDNHNMRTIILSPNGKGTSSMSGSRGSEVHATKPGQGSIAKTTETTFFSLGVI